MPRRSRQSRKPPEPGSRAPTAALATRSRAASGEWRPRILLGVAVILLILAAITTLPHPPHKCNLIGYRSVCAFVPLSTLTLLGGAGFVVVLRSSSRSGERPRRRERL